MAATLPADATVGLTTALKSESDEDGGAATAM
jgi:hypothetical protein